MPPHSELLLIRSEIEICILSSDSSGALMVLPGFSSDKLYKAWQMYDLISFLLHTSNRNSVVFKHYVNAQCKHRNITARN